MRQVEVEDLFLAESPLDLDGTGDLQQLGHHRPFVARLDQARHLHRQRRAAGDDAAMADELQKSTAERHRVDAVMIEEAPVLIGNQHAQELRIDIGDIGLQPPASLRRGEGAEQLAIGIEHFGRNDTGLVQRRRKGAVGGVEAEGQRHHREGAHPDTNSNFSTASSCPVLTAALPAPPYGPSPCGPRIADGTCPRRSLPDDRRFRE